MKEKGGMEEVMRGERKGCCIILFALYYFFFQWRPLVGIQGWSPPFSFGRSDLSPVTESQAILEYKGLSIPSSIPLILQLWKLRTSLLFSSSDMPNSWWPHDLQDARFLCPSLSPRVCSYSCLLSWWYYLILIYTYRLIYTYLTKMIKMINSVQFSYSVVSNPLPPQELQHARQLSITNFQSLLKLMSIGDAIQSSHPLPSPSPPAFNHSQPQGLF